MQYRYVVAVCYFCGIAMLFAHQLAVEFCYQKFKSKVFLSDQFRKSKRLFMERFGSVVQNYVHHQIGLFSKISSTWLACMAATTIKRGASGGSSGEISRVPSPQM